MDITKLTKQQLFEKCEQLKIEKYKSKTKAELIILIESKINNKYISKNIDLINSSTSKQKFIIEDSDTEENTDDCDNMNENIVDIGIAETKLECSESIELFNIKEISNIEKQKNEQFTIAETFVGCGGSHFGFKKSGFKSIFVNDIWDDAIKTLMQNDKDLNENNVICSDIKDLTEEYFKEKNINTQNLDVLIGGVVCKGFSLAGIRNPYDPRNYLYLQQLRLVSILKPKISIIENVPGMLNMKILTKNNDEELKNLCVELNDICEQHKKVRGRLITEKKKLASLNDENEIMLIQGIIENTKKEMEELTQKRKNMEKFLENKKYSVVAHIEKIYDSLGYDVHKKILTCSDYGCFTSRQRLFIVAVRRDLNIKWEYPIPTTKENKLTVKDAFDLIDYVGLNNPLNDNDNKPMNHNKSTVEKFKKIQCGVKSEEGYFSRGTSSRLSYDKPAPTLVPGHSSFQIHPTEHRSITVREGATITGFDTNFKFYGSHSSRCMQIGNAIPVNMAYALAEQCKKYLNEL